MNITLLFSTQFLMVAGITGLHKKFQLGLQTDGLHLMYYVMINALFASVNFMVAVGFRPRVNSGTLAFSLVYALAVIFNMCLNLAALDLMTIPLYTVLSSSGSIVTSSLFGFLYLKETATVQRLLALVVVLAAVVLPWAGKIERKQDARPTRALACVIVFLNGGLCGIICKLYAVTPGVLGSNHFFLLTNVIIAMICGCAVVVYANSQKLTVQQLVRFFRPGQIASIGTMCLLSNINAMINMAILTLIPITTCNIVSACITMSSSVLLSLLLFREKVSKKQLVSVLLVLLATVFNSL